jgi:hypothetical protein
MEAVPGRPLRVFFEQARFVDIGLVLPGLPE